MQRVLLPLLLLALAAPGGTLAHHLDPEERIRPADQARARAMLLEKRDVGPALQQLSPSTPVHRTCRALDESDLILTGKATSPSWITSTTVVFSMARVFASVRDARASWRRTVGSAPSRCSIAEIRRVLGVRGGTVSVERLPFPRVAQQVVASRLTVTTAGQTAVIDAVALGHSRAHAVVAIGGPLAAAPARSEEVRLARIVARRMAAAMRGA